jgi:hypothetical protein
LQPQAITLLVGRNLSQISRADEYDDDDDNDSHDDDYE